MSATSLRVAGDLLAGPSQNLISFENPWTDAFSSPADGFQIYERGFSPSIPFAVVDDSVSIFQPDELGIIGEDDTAPFFGITDTVNGDTTGPVEASWTFAVGGFADLELTLDLGAMGDFEAEDAFTFAYRIDDGRLVPLFEPTADEDGTFTYTLDGGASITLDDPLDLDGTRLTNDLQSFHGRLDGSGDTVEVVVTAETDGSEALVFRNLEITGAPVIASALGAEDRNLIEITNDAPAFDSAGDGFGIFQRGVSPTIPFGVLDDSVSIFEPDSLGIIGEDNLDPFFGIIDTRNSDNDVPVEASFAFNVGGGEALALALDLGAMGDFEADDSYVFEYRLDDGPRVELFELAADEALEATYTLDGGASFTLDDPLTLGDTVLTNTLETFRFDIDGTGERLELIITADTDGGSEAVALQNIVVTGEGAMPPAADPLPNGVAAGDTTSESTVLWARASTPGEVVFEVATDPSFINVVETVTLDVTDPLVPAKVEIDGLDSDTRYHYRATDASDRSNSGTFITAAAAGTLGGLTFGVSGDWRGELGPYPSIANADEQGLDLFVALGDTVYADFPSPAVPEPQAETLAEFRFKHDEVYATRFDVNTWADLRSSTSIYATIDDHEVTNDFAGGADVATDPRFTDQEGLINDSVLYENGLQAFQEYNPLRDAFYGDVGDPRIDGERELYRAERWGETAEIFVLDARSFRDASLPPVLDPTDGEALQAFFEDAFDPSRTLLGETQLEDLKQDLLAAEEDGVVWKFVMVPEPIQNLGPVLGQDRFEGYAAERTELLGFIDANDIDNVVFVAADVHATFVNNLTYQAAPGGPQIATSAFEVTTGSVAFDAPFALEALDLVEETGLLPQEQIDALRALDEEGPDAFNPAFQELYDAFAITPFGYDPIGLDDNLAEADGLIDAELTQGNWVAGNTFGWTEFDIDPATQALTVTTYGIEPYAEDELNADPDAVLARTPEIVSQFVVEPELPLTSISEIQGVGHVSPFVDLDLNAPQPSSLVRGSDVITTGIVTAVDGNGFYLQDPVGDGDPLTSDAILVFTGGTPEVSVGDEAQVIGTVAEFFPATGGLPITEIVDPSVNILSSGNTLPEAVAIGGDGARPPSVILDDDGFRDFEPETDGLDFFEALEGMLVTANDTVAISPSDGGDIFGLVDGGAGASGLNDARGTLAIGPDDFNPEKIQIIDDGGILADFDIGDVDVGAMLGDVTGVVSWDGGSYGIRPTAAFDIEDREGADDSLAFAAGAQDLTVASYNVLNLDRSDVEDGRFEAIAQQIVANLDGPDIIGLQEIQDNNGSIDDGTVAADETLQLLVDAIAAAGGPEYAFIDNTFITDGQSGGQPGGNIRTAFLYDPERVDVVEGSVRPVGSQAPGEAFNGSRLPLAADFASGDEVVTVVSNHFSSKGGSAPIQGTAQPFADLQEDPDVNSSLDDRRVQAQAVNDFVDDVVAGDPDANVVVLGDMNEFEFVSPLQILEGTVETNADGLEIDDTGLDPVLVNLIQTLPQEERSTFIFQGNAQTLDHILVSPNLAPDAEVDIVHVNSEQADTVERASDHDPLVARLRWPSEPNLVDGAPTSDRLAGTTADDLLFGRAGNDLLTGALGDDILVGGSGSNRLLGGEGADLFVLEAGGRQLVYDFAPTEDRFGLDDFGFDDLVFTTAGDSTQIATAAGAEMALVFGTDLDEIDIRELFVPFDADAIIA